MRLPCYLRQIRGQRSLSAMAAESGVNKPELSRIEQGIGLPKDRDVAAIEQAYGAPEVDWYPPRVLLAVIGDEEAELRANAVESAKVLSATSDKLLGRDRQ